MKKYDKLSWNYSLLSTPDMVLEKVHELSLQSKVWGYRGQPGEYANLLPSFDRKFPKISLYSDKGRRIKVEREIRNVELFRQTLIANNISIKGSTKEDYLYTLAVLQHYNGVTRLLDWSFSPFIALYFAVCKNENELGEIWTFEYDQYEKNASLQWEKYPKMRNNDYSDAFLRDNLDDWFSCQFYPRDAFPRLFAQNGFFSFTSQFQRDHAKVIPRVLNDCANDYHFLYLIDNQCKAELRKYLYENMGIWHGSVYPDLTGSAEGIVEVVNDEIVKVKNSTRLIAFGGQKMHEMDKLRKGKWKGYKKFQKDEYSKGSHQ